MRSVSSTASSRAAFASWSDEGGVAEAPGELGAPGTDDDLLPLAREREAVVVDRQRRHADHRLELALAPGHVHARDRASERPAAPRRGRRPSPAGCGTRTGGRSPSAASGRAGRARAAAGSAVERQVAPHRREHLRLARLVGVLAQRLRAAPARARRRARARPRPSRTARSSWPAVLSPMPGTPGMLSDVSPLRPMKSGTCSGLTP